jgi:hypothetical protein
LEVKATVRLTDGLRICIISLLRVIYVHNLNLADFWYSSAGLANWSVLEPTLGIVNACLPVLRPVAQKILGSKVFAWKSGSGEGSAQAISRRSFSYGVKRGEKCTDDGESRLSSGAERQLYPLDTISVGGTEQHTTHFKGRENDFNTHGHQIHQSHGIGVTREWTVHTNAKDH